MDQFAMIAMQSLTKFDDFRLAPGFAGTARHETMKIEMR